MRRPIARRQLLQSMLGAACVAAGMPARAGKGKVLYGFAQASVGFPMATALLRELSGRYQPDLGLDLTYLPGNSGALAMDAASKAVPDGGTMLLTPSSLMTLAPHLRTVPGVDPTGDFVPVAALARIGMALAVSAQVPAQVKSLKDYAGWVRANPALGVYGVPGLASAVHFNGMVMARSLDVPLKPVAYKGTVAIAADLASGSLPAAFLISGPALQAALAQGVRLLAVTGDTRWPALPHVPTMAESGVADLLPAESFGFFMSTRVPAGKVREIGDDIRQALRGATMQAAMARDWHLPLPAAAEDYAAMLIQERATWAQLIRTYRFTTEA